MPVHTESNLNLNTIMKDKKLYFAPECEEAERVCLPVSFLRRKDELFAGYDLSSGPHTLTLIWNNPVPGYSIKAGSIVTYDKE